MTKSQSALSLTKVKVGYIILGGDLFTLPRHGCLDLLSVLSVSVYSCREKEQKE